VRQLRHYCGRLGIGASALILIKQRYIVELLRPHDAVRPGFRIESRAIEPCERVGGGFRDECAPDTG
jgi:hypothetical protein